MKCVATVGTGRRKTRRGMGDRRRENNISNPVDLWMNGNKYDPKRTYALKPDK